MSNERYIKAKATLKNSNVTIIENLKVSEFEYDIDIFERWKSKLLINCGFEVVEEESGND